MGESAHLLVVCTGNVARSPMLAVMLDTLAEDRGREWAVRSAGTLAGEGDRVSPRTLAAMAPLVEVDASFLALHRSHRLGASDVAWADAILTAEADHVRHIRLAFPEATLKTVSVGQLIAGAPEGEPLSTQVGLVAAREPDDHHDVTDPAGGDQSVYDDAAAQLWVIARQLAFGAAG
ncbi:MAG TPA: hypothetical protein PLS29_01025 [Acidimicrobiales bacterium]|nr:hypothetical protein [Acidimicrobiales bacterium]